MSMQPISSQLDWGCGPGLTAIEVCTILRPMPERNRFLNGRRCLWGLWTCLLIWNWAAGPDGFVEGGAVWAFTLKMPAAGTTVQAGKSVAVAVSVGKEVNLRAVRYYWYRMDEEPLASHQATPATFSAGRSGLPFSGSVSVPVEALGTMRLLAVGEVARGRLESYEEFDEVLVTVDTTAALTAIDFTIRKPWRLESVGKRMVVPAVGLFDDGILRPLSGPGTGSRYRVSDDHVVAVDVSGVLQVTGPGKAVVTVENRGRTGTVEVVVEANEEINRAPIAEVTGELRVKSGALVILDGLRSHDPDGDLLHYEWKQILGHRVALTNVNEAKASFVAPKVSEPKRYRFSLVVTDMAGPDVMKGADSLPAVITVWVTP